MSKKPFITSDGIEILDELFIRDDKEMQHLLAEERKKSSAAMEIYNLRKKHNLTQKQLARKIGTSASVIARLESANYAGHSQAMLQRIADALGAILEIKFVDGSVNDNNRSISRAAFELKAHFNLGNSNSIAITSCQSQYGSINLSFNPGVCHGQNFRRFAA